MKRILFGKIYKTIVLLVGVIAFVSIEVVAESVVYDGKKKLVIVPEYIVEFPVQNDTAQKKIQRYDPGAAVVSVAGNIKVWRLQKRIKTRTSRPGVLPDSLPDNCSPAFRDASGKIKALPGNIIVYMKKSWNADKVTEWAQSNGLVVIKQLSSYSNMYLVQSPAGIQSLELANKLRGMAGVRKVVPNWWSRVYRR